MIFTGLLGIIFVIRKNMEVWAFVSYTLQLSHAWKIGVSDPRDFRKLLVQVASGSPSVDSHGDWLFLEGVGRGMMLLG